MGDYRVEKTSSKTSAKPGAASDFPSPHGPPALLRRQDLYRHLNLGRMTVHRLLQGDPTFPKSVRPTRRIAGVALRWRRDEVDAWVASLRNEV